MGFQDSLRRVSENLDDSLGIAIVGMDGIIVEEYKKDKTIDISSLGAEYCTLFKEAENASQQLNFGVITEISLSSERIIIIMRRINNEYFLILALKAEGNFGKGRFLLKRELEALTKEF